MPYRIRRLIGDPLTWITALVVAYAIIVAVRPSEAWFGVPGEWTWSGRPPAVSTLRRWPPAIAALAVTATFAVLMDRRWHRTARLGRASALASLAVAIPTIQLLLKAIHYRYPLEFYLYRTIGPHNGFWQAASQIASLADYLRSYPEAMRAARSTFIHLTTAPPGAIVYLWGWRQAFSMAPNIAHAVAQAFRGYACADLAFVTLSDAQIASALGQMMVPLWSGLTVVPIYLWAAQLGDRRSGWRAAALFTLLPTLSLFTMRWDTLYPLFTATAFAALHRGVTTGRARWWAFAGIIVSLASFWSFGNAILAPATALYAALALWRQDREPQPAQDRGQVDAHEAGDGNLASRGLRALRTLISHGREWAALLAGGYSTWAVFRLATGVSVWQILAMTRQVQFSLRGAYDYRQWLFYNLLDILAMSGFPVTLPFLIASVAQLRREKAQTSGVPALTFVATILAINLSGLSPGEVARLWLHLTTGIIVAAVVWLRRTTTRDANDRRTFAWLMALMAFQGLWLSLFLRVSETGMPSYVPRTVRTSSAAPATAPARFDRDLVLTNVVVTPGIAVPGKPLQVALTWHAPGPTDTPFTVFVHLVDATGALTAQKDAMPVQNTLPTTCWVAGEVIEDTYELDLPLSAAPGLYSLHIGWYDLRTMERLRLLEGGSDAFILPDIVEVR